MDTRGSGEPEQFRSTPGAGLSIVNPIGGCVPGLLGSGDVGVSFTETTSAATGHARLGVYRVQVKQYSHMYQRARVRLHDHSSMQRTM